MKVIEIRKTYRNGTKIFHKLVPDVSHEEMQEIARDEVEQDQAGHIYGYNFTWGIVTDLEIIKKVVKEEWDSVGLRIIALQDYHKEIKTKFPDLFIGYF